jgi:hypothetical protein
VTEQFTRLSMDGEAPKAKAGLPARGSTLRVIALSLAVWVGTAVVAEVVEIVFDAWRKENVTVVDQTPVQGLEPDSVLPGKHDTDSKPALRPSAPRTPETQIVVGYVRDSVTGMAVPGATISVLANGPKVYGVSDQSGEYQIPLPKEVYSVGLGVTKAGYRDKGATINPHKPPVTFYLVPLK